MKAISYIYISINPHYKSYSKIDPLHKKIRFANFIILQDFSLSISFSRLTSEMAKHQFHNNMSLISRLKKHPNILNFLL